MQINGIVVPEIGSKWTHHNGTPYVVILITNETSSKKEYPPTVVYRNPTSNSVWSRPLSDWYRSMTRVPDDTSYETKENVP